MNTSSVSLNSTFALHDALPICSEPESHHEYKNIFKRSAQQIKDLGMTEYVEQYALGPARQTLLNKDPVGWHLFKKHMAEHRDRKSTRLNSSHVAISYAVCCLIK